jgi:hypothetical protein
MDFAHFTEEQREEWRRSEITSAALSMLREAETLAAQGVLRAAEQEADSVSVSRAAGCRLGLEQAIDLLTRNHEKQTR